MRPFSFAAVVLVALNLALPGVAAEAPTWGALEPGPHAVGFRLVERLDVSRPFRPWRGQGSAAWDRAARPMRISVWYPARAAQGPALTFGDYTAMIGGETRLGPLGPEEARQGEQALFGFPVLRDLTPEQRTALLALAGRARRDAPAAEGRFPVVLYSLGSAALCHSTAEYLASHGYVVLQMPRLGASLGLPDTGADGDLDVKARDMDFLLNVARELPGADLDAIGTIGFSAGGRWALGAAMRHPAVRAVVSLDSVMLFGDTLTRAWKATAAFAPAGVRAPVLHLIRKEWVPREDPALWQSLEHADRTYVRLDQPGLDHLDLQSIGYATTLVGGRPALKAAVADTFHAFHRLTLAFLDTHVKGERSAAAAARAPQGLPAALATTTFTPGTPAPLSQAEFLGQLEEQGVDAAISTFRSAWQRLGSPPASEQVVNLAGYALLNRAAGVEAARKLFELNAEAHPQSANVYDSLSDAYLAAGDAARGRALAEKALALLDADQSLAPDRRERLREAYKDKLARLQ